jgi:putative transposase
MTKIMVATCGWMYRTIVLDWHTKKTVGCELATQSWADHWLRALQRAVSTQFPQRIRDGGKRLWLVSDNGSQPTSR